MKKVLSVLPIFPILLFLVLVLPNSASAATVNIADVISTSQANKSPLGDCVGPDKKHLQTTKEVCEALNKGWGKSNVSFQVRVVPPTAVADALVASKTNNSPTGDCTGPDKKHFQSSKEVCEALYKSWGKTAVTFAPGVTVSTSSNIGELIAQAEKSTSKGDCTGPDKKHLETTKEVCETLNKSWGKTVVSFKPIASTSTKSDKQSSNTVTTTSTTSGSDSTSVTTTTKKDSDKTEDKTKTDDKSKK